MKSAALSESLESAIPTAVKQSRPYTAYRPTTVWGLDKLPNHWQEKPLKRLVRINTDKLPDSTDPDHEIEYVDIGNVTLDKGITSSERLRFEVAPSRARRLVCEGDTIVSTVRTYLKAVAQIAKQPDNLVVSTGFAVLRACSELDPGYLYRLIQSEAFIGRIMAHSVGVSYPAINASDIGAFPIQIPPIAEQRSIAMFLDRETTKIDNLIASKEHVIALFEERRIALISSAVTRGVSTNKTAVPSADWLDDIPSSWSLLPFRRALTGIEQGWSPQADQRSAEGDEWAVLKVGAVYKGRFRPEEHKALPADLEPETRFEVREGDLLLTRGNTPELVADACVVPATRDRLMLSDLHYRLTLDERRLLKRFACYWLISRAGRQQIEADAHGTSNSMVKVSQRDIRSWIVPLPRLDEQERIATFLDEQSRQTDAMISRIAEGITRLREYRSSLISVAVTGQIDVRSYRPEATCQ